MFYMCVVGVKKLSVTQARSNTNNFQFDLTIRLRSTVKKQVRELKSVQCARGVS